MHCLKISVLDVSLLSQGLKTVEIISNISYTRWVMITNVAESEKECENTLMEKNLRVLFCIFFLFRLSRSNHL